MIRTKGVTIEAGEFRRTGIDLEIADGEYAALMGSTGCGKTTLLESIAGLRSVGAGTITVAGLDVTRLRPGARGIGYVPQDAALFSSLTVERHLAFALELRRWPATDRAERVGWLADRLGIAPLLGRRPAGLSGGEAQRVALGRALSFRPSVLLLDEPLSALDDSTRDEMRTLIGEIVRAEGVTVLHVTHRRSDVEELADRVIDFGGDGRR